MKSLFLIFSPPKKYINARITRCTFITNTMDARLQTPFSMGIFGCRNSGKSVFTKTLLISDLIDVPFKKVFWIYKTWQDELFKEIAGRLNI